MVRKVPFVALLFFCTAVNMADIGQVRFDENVYLQELTVYVDTHYAVLSDEF